MTPSISPGAAICLFVLLLFILTFTFYYIIKLKVFSTFVAALLISMSIMIIFCPPINVINDPSDYYATIYAIIIYGTLIITIIYLFISIITDYRLDNYNLYTKCQGDHSL